jgi:hypothetical protein
MKGEQQLMTQQQVSAGRLQELRAMTYGEYLQTPEWQITRKRILERDRYRCQGCNAHDVLLTIHHYTQERIGSEHDEDLVTLCEVCLDQLRRLIADPPKLSLLQKCSVGLGTALLGTIGIEGFLHAPFPAEIAVLVVAFLAAKNSPALYGKLKGMLPAEVMAWLGNAPEEGKPSWWDIAWARPVRRVERDDSPARTEEDRPGPRRDRRDQRADEGELQVARKRQPKPDQDDDLDLQAPREQGAFLFTEVLERFEPTLDRIYLGTLLDGTHIFCNHDELCHVALAGATDAGKSNIMRMLIVQLCYVGCKVLVLNPHWTGYVLKKDEDWTPMIPYLFDDPFGCRAYDKIEYYLNYLANKTIPHRLDLYAQSRPTGKPIFVVLDELPAIVKRLKAVPGYLDTILKEGRKVGVYLISAAQDYLVDTIGGTGAVRDCYRTAYSVGGDDTTTNKLLGKTKADRPLGKGVVLLRNASSKLCREAVVALLPYVDNECLYRLLGPSTYVPVDETDTEEVEDLELLDARSRTAGDMRRAPGAMPTTAKNQSQEQETAVVASLHKSITTILDLYQAGKLTDDQMSKLIDALPVQSDEQAAPTAKTELKAEAAVQEQNPNRHKLTTLHQRVLEHYTPGLGLRKLGELVGVGKDKAGSLLQELRKWGYLQDDQANPDE